MAGNKSDTLNQIGDLTASAKVYLRQPCFTAYLSGGQTIAPLTRTKINFRNVDFDTEGEFDAVSTYQYTPKIPGKYLLSASTIIESFSSNALGLLFLYKNDEEFATLSADSPGVYQNRNCGLSGSIIVHSNGSDSWDIRIHHDEGRSRSIAYSLRDTYFTGYLINAFNQ